MSNRMSDTATGGESIRQVTAGLRSRVILAVVCATSLVCATSARVEGHNDYDDKVRKTKTYEHEKNFPWSEFNPCRNNNLVAGLGDRYSVVITNRPTGRILSDTTTRIHQNGKGTNLEVPSDTAVYTYDFWNEVHIRSTTRNYTYNFQIIKQLNRSGNRLRHDDWSYRESLRLSGLTPEIIFVTKESSSSRCK